MILLKKISKLFILFFLSNVVYSQSYNFKNYTTEQGLPQSQVLSIFQDTKGYMWFGTNSGGVTKFDGVKFTTYTTQNGLIDNTVYAITNHNNKLLFGTSQGLCIYNEKNFSVIEKKIGTVYKLLSKQNKTWVGTEKGAYLLQNNTLKFFNEDSLLNKSSVYTIYIDNSKNIWFGTIQNGVIVYNPSSNKFKHFNATNGLMSNFVFSIAQKNDGTVLIGTRTGLNKVDKNFNVTPANELPANFNISYSCVIDNGNDEFLFGTHSEGLINFDFKKNKRTKIFNINNGLVNNPIVALLKDREGNLWVGTDGSGVFKYYNEKFTYYTKVSGLPEEVISAVAQDVNNNLWIATRSNGVIKKNKTEFIKYKFNPKQPNSLPDNDINAILPLDNGSVLFGTKDGLCIYENNQFKTFMDETIRHKYILALYKDSKNIIWIATAEGTFMLNDNNFKTCDKINSKNTSTQFLNLCISEDKENNIWIGTDKGIIKYNNNIATEFNQTNGYTNKQTNCSLVDAKGALWLGTDNDLFVYSNGIFKKIVNQNNQSFGYINFLQQKNNKLYIGSNNGIDILDLTDYYHLKITIKHLAKDDGLLSLESNYGASNFDNYGRLMVGTVKGLEIYDPLLDKPNTNEALINITELKLFYGQQNIFKYDKVKDSTSILPKQLVLPYTKNNLTFCYVGLSLIAPEKVMYQYMLEGIDIDWAPASFKTEASYPSLPPGKYKFLVKATNNDGVWNKVPAMYEFQILNPWYSTWWFYSICVFVIIASIIIYNYLKTKKLIADRSRLEQVVNIRTKELRKEKEKVEQINKEVTQQKQLIEQKQNEILSSIRYAKRIQQSLMPTEKYISRVINKKS